MTETITRDLQELVKALYAEADKCEMFNIDSPAKLLREAAAVIQPEANSQTMDMFAEVTSAGHLAELVDNMRMELHQLADEFDEQTELNAPAVADDLRRIAKEPRQSTLRFEPAEWWRDPEEDCPEEGQEVLAAIHPYGNKENRMLIVHAVYADGRWVCPAEHSSLHAPIYWMPAPALPFGA